MLQRVDFGDETRNLPFLLCVMLIARQELSEYSVAQLMFNKIKLAQSELDQISALLSKMSHVFTRREHESMTYWSFQNGSIKSTLASSEGGPSQLKLTYREALTRFLGLSKRWRSIMNHVTESARELGRHLLIFDIEYALQLNTSEATREITDRFLDIDYILAYIDVNSVERVGNLAEVYARLRRAMSEQENTLKRGQDQLLKAWERFFRQNRAILERAHSSAPLSSDHASTRPRRREAITAHQGCRALAQA